MDLGGTWHFGNGVICLVYQAEDPVAQEDIGITPSHSKKGVMYPFLIRHRGISFLIFKNQDATQDVMERRVRAMLLHHY